LFYFFTNTKPYKAEKDSPFLRIAALSDLLVDYAKKQSDAGTTPLSSTETLAAYTIAYEAKSKVIIIVIIVIYINLIE
jgi:hypothetical protein